MSSTSATDRARTYGGWRRRRSIGLLGLGTTATLGVLGGVLVLLLLGAVSLTLLMYVAPPIAVAAGLGLLRVDGTPVAQLVVRRARWWRGTARRHTKYRAGVVVEHPRAFQLPGVLAPMRLLDAEDGAGGRYGLVWDRRAGYLTATLRVIPASTHLADRADADAWVANWGGWLASLGYVPMLRWVTVTVDTAPEPGTTLADSVAASVDPRAPEAARTILGELVAAAPGAAADVDTRVSITFNPAAAPSPPKSLEAAIAEVGRTLHTLQTALGTCGVTITGRASAADLAGIVRTAYDPAARGHINHLAEVRETGDVPSWQDAGPVGAEELWDRYRHDSGVSVSWAWHDAPRQNVHADVLARLLSPGPHPKRVALQYRPLPAVTATRVLENEVRAAEFRREYRRRTRRDETARDSADHARAQQAAAEEAQGAGVCLINLFVTATVADESDLARAVADTEASAEQSKIRLRRMWRSQAAGFAATLPCGICPSELANRTKH
ncbi:MAG TPA: SCO6880 family protein [Streptosporangiaceae bacterium]|jgi:hypothetical protein